MPIVSINFWAVLVAAAINMVVGSLWYSRMLFADRWMKSINKTKADLGQPGPAMGLAVIGALLMSYVLAHFVSYALAVTAVDGARTGFWVWAGFVLPVVTMITTFEKRGRDWFLITASYYLVVLLVNGALLASWVK
jgi:hypothetical protein